MVRSCCSIIASILPGLLPIPIMHHRPPHPNPSTRRCTSRSRFTSRRQVIPSTCHWPCPKCSALSVKNHSGSPAHSCSSHAMNGSRACAQVCRGECSDLGGLNLCAGERCGPRGTSPLMRKLPEGAGPNESSEMSGGKTAKGNGLAERRDK